MFALRLAGFLVILVLIWVFLTQILIPLFTNKPLFPSFRRSSKTVRTLEREVRDLHGTVSDLTDAKELTEHKSGLNRQKQELEEAIKSTDQHPPDNKQ